MDIWSLGSFFFCRLSVSFRHVFGVESGYSTTRGYWEGTRWCSGMGQEERRLKSLTRMYIHTYARLPTPSLHLPHLFFPTKKYLLGSFDWIWIIHPHKLLIPSCICIVIFWLICLCFSFITKKKKKRVVQYIWGHTRYVKSNNWTAVVDYFSGPPSVVRFTWAEQKSNSPEKNGGLPVAWIAKNTV
jgi:hypothetical protein